MAKTPSEKPSDSGDDLIKAVDASKPDAPSDKAAATTDTKPAKDDSKDKKADGEKKQNVVVAFVYNHPWIVLFIGYLLLTALVKVWGWATIVFLLIPIICFGRLWMLSRNTDTPIDTEDHEKIYWWARAGFISSIFGLASALILNWMGFLHIFN